MKETIRKYNLDNLLMENAQTINGEFDLKSVCDFQNKVKLFIRELEAFVVNAAVDFKKIDNKLAIDIFLSEAMIILNIIIYKNYLNGIIITVFAFNTIINKLKQLYLKKQIGLFLDKYSNLYTSNMIRIDALDYLKDYLRDKELTFDQVKQIVETVYPIYKEDIEELIQKVSLENEKDLLITNSNDEIVLEINNDKTRKR